MKLVVFGASGMIGSGVLLTALRDPGASTRLAQAMLRVARDGAPGGILESRDINALAAGASP